MGLNKDLMLKLLFSYKTSIFARCDNSTAISVGGDSFIAEFSCVHGKSFFEKSYVSLSFRRCDLGLAKRKRVGKKRSDPF